MSKDIIVTNINKLDSKHIAGNPQYLYDFYPVTDNADKHEVTGAFHENQCVAAFYSILPGKSNYPFHYHTNNEEVFYIISGNGILETSTGSSNISTGDIIVCPAGEKGAHKLTNSSETENLVYLDVDTNNTPDIVFYPHSGKLGVRTVGGFRDNYKLDSNVDYYDGE